MDINTKGKIEIDELRVGLQKLGQQIPDADLQILMDAIRIWCPFDLLLLMLSYKSHWQIEKGKKYSEKGVFYSKRQKLRQWVADTSLHKVDELSSKGTVCLLWEPTSEILIIKIRGLYMCLQH